MKKPIDPNLNNNENQNLLFGDDIIDDVFKKTDDKNIVEDILEGTGGLKEVAKEASTPHHHHHHHSSSGAHHSHSSHSGSHHHSSHSGSHSSSGSHHHSSHGASHSSSGSHHHHHHSHSSHSSSHKSNKNKKKMPVWAKVIISIILIIALLISGTVGAYMIIKNKGANDLSSIAKTDTAHQEIITYKGHRYEFNENVVSVAFMGVDQRDLLNNTQTDFVGCTDADIVVTVDISTGAAKVIAIPRDTMVDVDQYSTNNVFLKTSNVQLCLAYAYGDGKEKSCKNVADAMSRILLDVPIQKYFALDLDGIKPLNDAIGGVKVTSTYDIPKHNIKKGQEVTLRGDMAEAYVRTRDMDTINASLNRTDRQVQYVKAYINQVIPAVMNDVGIVSDLYNTANQYSRTNLSLNNVTYLASVLLNNGVTDYEVYKLEGKMTEEHESDFPDAVFAQFHPDEDSIMETVLSVYYTQID